MNAKNAKKGKSRMKKRFLIACGILTLLLLFCRIRMERLIYRLGAEETRLAECAAQKIATSWSTMTICHQLKRCVGSKDSLSVTDSNVAFYLIRILAERAASNEIGSNELQSIFPTEVIISPTLYQLTGYAEGFDVFREESELNPRSRNVYTKDLFDFFFRAEMFIGKSRSPIVPFPQKNLGLVFCGEYYPIFWGIRNTSDVPIRVKLLSCDIPDFTLTAETEKSFWENHYKAKKEICEELNPGERWVLYGLFKPQNIQGGFSYSVDIQFSNGENRTLSFKGHVGEESSNLQNLTTLGVNK